MKKSSLLALALSPLALGASLAQAQDAVVTTDPVGFVKLDIEPGLQTAGISMVNPAVSAGSITAKTATTVTANSDAAAALDADGAYYLEITDGPDTLFVGDRLEVDVAGSSGSTIAIDTASSRNTIADLSSGDVDLDGYAFVIRPHVTLGQVFGTASNPLMHGSSSFGNADQVLLFRDGGFVTYYYYDFLSTQEWRQVGQGTSANNVVIAPGEGLFVRRVASAGPVELTTVLGEVRMNNFAQPLNESFNLIAEGHPVDNSPASRMFTVDNGFTGASSFANADQIQVFDSVSGGFVTYYLYSFLSTTEWRQVGSSTDRTNDVLMAADDSVFVRKINADPHYVAPVTF